MTSQTTKIHKEVRELFWPWCGVMIAASLPLSYPLAFLLGIPLLASLSFGNEFRHRTLSLLLSQPEDRMKVWGGKLSVMLISVLSVVLVCGVRAAFDFHNAREVFKEAPNEALAGLMVLAGLWFVITVASAAFWTLLSRSTLGGLGLMFVQSVFFAVAFIFVMLASWKVEGAMEWFGITIWPHYKWMFVVAFVFLPYAVVMLRLGRRKLAQFEITGGTADHDLMMAGPSVMPEVFARLFRSRPAGASLNLILKELRLLRPLWLLLLLLVLCGTSLRITSWLIPHASETIVVLSPLFTVAIVLLAPVLAGSLSLGEERTLGLQSWHMTQPVSARRQWLIKLVMAMIAGIVCTVLVPLFLTTVDAFLPGPRMGAAPARPEILFLLMMSLLSFAAFWCACAVNGTVRAVLWVFPLLGGLSLASRFGSSLGELAAPGNPIEPLLRITTGPAAMVWLVVPTLLLALIQSYRLFRTEPQDSVRPVIRYLLPLVIVAFVSAFSLRVFGLG